MLPNAIKFRGAVYVIAGKGPVTWIRRNPGPGRNQRDPKHPGRNTPQLPNLRTDKLQGDTAELHTEINQLQRAIKELKTQYSGLFSDYNKAQDKYDKIVDGLYTPVGAEAEMSKDALLREVGQSVKVLDYKIDRLEKDIPKKQARIKELQGEIAEIEQSAALGAADIKQVSTGPLVTQETPIFKQQKQAPKTLTLPEAEQKLISLEKLLAHREEFPDKGWSVSDRAENMQVLLAMIEQTKKEIARLKGETPAADPYAGIEKRITTPAHIVQQAKKDPKVISLTQELADLNEFARPFREYSKLYAQYTSVKQNMKDMMSGDIFVPDAEGRSEQMQADLQALGAQMNPLVAEITELKEAGYGHEELQAAIAAVGAELQARTKEVQGELEEAERKKKNDVRSAPVKPAPVTEQELRSRAEAAQRQEAYRRTHGEGWVPPLGQEK